MKNCALVLFLSLFAFAAKANSPTENALAHPANEMTLEVGNDTFLDPIIYGENDASVGLAKADAEEVSALGEPVLECDVTITLYEWYYSEKRDDGSCYEEWGYMIEIEIRC